METHPDFTPDERLLIDAFLRLLTAEEFAQLRDYGFPQVTGRPSRLQAIIAEESLRRRGHREAE